MASNTQFGKGGLQSRAPLAGTKIGAAIQKSKKDRIRTSVGGSSSASNVAAAEKAAEEARLREEQRKAAQDKARVEAEIRAARDFAEKQRIARAFVQRRNAEKQRRLINQQRNQLLNRGVRARTVLSRDINTGNRLRVTQWRDRKGNRVERINNLTTGETVLSAFKKPKRGSVRQTGGILTKTSIKEKEGQKKLTATQQKKEKRKFNLRTLYSQRELEKEIGLLKKQSLGKLQKEKEELRKKLDQLIKKGNKGIISKARINLQKKLVRAKQQEINSARLGEPIKILAGDLPLVPAAAIPSTVTTIRFIGTQKRGKAGKILTDLLYTTSRGEVGLAKGVSVQKGKRVASVVLGRSGKIMVKLPSGRRTIRGITSFVGREAGKTKGGSVRIQKTIDLLNKRKKLGSIKASKNLKVIDQVNIGQVGSFKGKVQKGGLIGERLNQNLVASVSKVLTKKDLTKIVGRSITTKSGKVNFFGIIKGQKSLTKRGGKYFVGGKTVTKTEALQYKKALKQVTNVVSGSVNKVVNQKGRVIKTTGLVSAIAKNIKKATAGNNASAKISQLARTKIQTSPSRVAVRTSTVRRVKNVTQTRSRGKTRIRSKSSVSSKSKSKQARKTNTIQRSKQAQKSRQAQKTKLLQKQVQASRSRGFSNTPRVTPTKKVPFIPKIKLLKGYKKQTLKRPKQTYLVITRKRGRFVSLTPRPLELKDAKDLLAYTIDNTLIKTGWFRPLGSSKVSVLPPKKVQGYFSKVSRKLRPYKIRQGKKKELLNGYIEKRKFFVDTKGERTQISRLRKKRKVTPTQRKKLLANLKKARLAKKKKNKKK